MAGLISPPLFGKGESVLRRIKMLLAVTTIMATLLAMNAGPALADDDGCIGPRGDNGNCIGVETDRGHHDDWNDWDWNDRDWNDRHDLFLNDFDDFDHRDSFLNDFDDCEFIGWDGDEAIYVCEVDFDW
jgi:hypothetical protein